MDMRIFNQHKEQHKGRIQLMVIESEGNWEAQQQLRSQNCLESTEAQIQLLY